MSNETTITSTGQALMFAGIALVQGNPILGLELIGVGVLLTILVAYLQKKGLDVKSNPQG